MDLSPLLYNPCISPIAYQPFFDSVFLNLKHFLQFTILSSQQLALIFALEREHADLPPTDKPSEVNGCHFLFLLPLF